jgi:hypothetical protein
LGGIPEVKTKLDIYDAARKWEKIFGDKYPSWVQRISGGTLFVSTESPSVAQGLMFDKKRMMERINKEMGFDGVKEINISISTKEEES